MAKKKTATKVTKKVSGKTTGGQAKQPVQPHPVPKIVVFFEFSGVAGVRFHGEYTDVERARHAARSLVLSPDVAQAWIMQDLEIIRKQSG